MTSVRGRTPVPQSGPRRPLREGQGGLLQPRCRLPAVQPWPSRRCWAVPSPVPTLSSGSQGEQPGPVRPLPWTGTRPRPRCLLVRAGPSAGSLGRRARPLRAAIHTPMSKLRPKNTLSRDGVSSGRQKPSVPAAAAPGPAEMGQRCPPQRLRAPALCPQGTAALTRLSARRRSPLRRSLHRRLRRRVPAKEAAPQPHHLHPAAGRSPLLPAPGLCTHGPLLAGIMPAPCQLPACFPHAPCPACPILPAPLPRWPCYPHPCLADTPVRRRDPSRISALLPSISSRPWKPFLLKLTTPMCSLGKSWL